MGKPVIDLAGLTADQKLQLIDDLWESLDPGDLALTAEQRAELDRRLALLDHEGPVGTPWEAVRSEMSGTRR